MDIFAIVCLVVLLLTGQHLINWMWRSKSMTSQSDGVAFTIIVTIAGMALTYWGIIILIDWGCQIN